MLRVATLLLVALALAACGSSEEDIQSDWKQFVEERNACETVDDCAVIGPGCPLGCSTAINKMYEQEALEYADELISDYERGGRSCAYSCLPTELVCEENRCQAVPEQ